MKAGCSSIGEKGRAAKAEEKKYIYASIEEIDEYFIKLQLMEIDCEKFYELSKADEKMEYLSKEKIKKLEITYGYKVKNEDLLEEGMFYKVSFKSLNKQIEDDIIEIEFSHKMISGNVDLLAECDDSLMILELDLKFTEEIYRLMESKVQNLCSIDKFKNYFITSQIGVGYTKDWNEKYLEILEKPENNIDEIKSYKDKMAKLLKINGVGIKKASIILNAKYPLEYIVYSDDISKFLNKVGFINNNKMNYTEKYSIYNDYMGVFIKTAYDFKYGFEDLKLNEDFVENFNEYLKKVNFYISEKLKLSNLI